MKTSHRVLVAGLLVAGTLLGSAPTALAGDGNTWKADEDRHGWRSADHGCTTRNVYCYNDYSWRFWHYRSFITHRMWAHYTWPPLPY